MSPRPALSVTRRTLVAGLCARCLLSGQEPEITSFDLSLLDGFITPAELFFVREHFPIPQVSAAGWKLSIDGAIAQPIELSYDELVKQSAKLLVATLECAENPVGGGLISNAEWRGVSLESLLGTLRPAPEARAVRMSGADGFSRTIPLSKAMHPASMIAYSMNGERLGTRHGFPLRAVFPGWYGMDSIKWLRAIRILTDEDPQQGYQRELRSLFGNRPGGPVTSMRIKSAFSRPADGAILTQRQFVLRGAAWAGEDLVRRVEVSTDGASSWVAARLDAEPVRYAWVYWSLLWKIPAPGEYELAVRATDDKGRQQQSSRASDRVDSYELNSWQRIRVTVV